jgi:hypothetical protein
VLTRLASKVEEAVVGEAAPSVTHVPATATAKVTSFVALAEFAVTAVTTASTIRLSST